MNSAPIEVDDSTSRMRRTAMVARLREHGITNQRVLDVMAAVPRHLFVPPEQGAHAYEDRALAIGFEQTISQPYMVAIMLQELSLTGSERVLDVGTGSGYQAALLSLLADHVMSVDMIPELAEAARQRLEQLGFRNVEVAVSNGSIGYHERAPYDAIIVAAAAPRVPTPLVDQLQEDGVLLVPVGEGAVQQLIRVDNQAGELQTRMIAECAFVPLVGQKGVDSSRHPGDPVASK